MTVFHVRHENVQRTQKDYANKEMQETMKMYATKDQIFTARKMLMGNYEKKKRHQQIG